MIQTMILCAGRGTRLMPLTRELPKPLVPVGDRPALSLLAAALTNAGARWRAVNTHHLANKILAFINSYDKTIHVSHETSLLGTAGGVRAALPALQDAALLLCNADILTVPCVSELVQGLARAPMVLAVEIAQAGQGNVGMDASGRIVRLRQEAIAREATGGYYVGTLAMQPDCFGLLPKRGCLIGDVAIPLMRRRGGLLGVPHQHRWSDIGSLAAYLDENLHWLRSAGLSHGDAWLDPSADVEAGVELHGALVGAGASVRGSGALNRVVVWPGATAVAPLENAVVTCRSGSVSVR